MQLVDTHCHIHGTDYPLDRFEVMGRAHQAGVTHLICVGTDAKDSKAAVTFAQEHLATWASIGVHPHEASLFDDHAKKLVAHLATQPKVVAVGECGLDYFYNHSPKEAQIAALRFQLELAKKHDLPLIFHVRDAFDDFWPIFDEYKDLRGVLHSFTDTTENMQKALDRGLHIGINGITTFTKNDWQLQNAKAIPLDRLLLETDAPFLTPVPHRGKINEPVHVGVVAKFLADLRGESLDVIADATTQNAQTLFKLY